MRADIRTIFSRNLNRILDLRNHPRSGLGRAARLAEMFGMSLPSAQKWLKEGALPDPSRYSEIREKLGCSLDDLFCDDDQVAVVEKNQVLISVISGLGRLDVSLPTDLISELGWPIDAVLLRVSDRGMEPFVVPGDFVIFSPSYFNFSGDGIYVIYSHKKYAVRRISQLLTNNMRLSTSGRQTDHFEDVDISQIRFGMPATDQNDSFLYIIGPVVSRLLVNR